MSEKTVVRAVLNLYMGQSAGGALLQKHAMAMWVSEREIHNTHVLCVRPDVDRAVQKGAPLRRSNGGFGILVCQVLVGFGLAVFGC